MNNWIFILETIVVFGLVTFVGKVFKKEGLIAWVGIASVLANVITAKNVDVFGLSTAIGTVMFASTFLATDILSENYGKSSARKAVYFGLFSTAVLIIAMQIALAYAPSAFDYADSPMRILFGLNIRVSVASMVMYFIANMGDVLLFNKLKEKTGGKHLWLRNNVSTILCNCLENFGFIFLAFYGVYDLPTVANIAISTSIVEMIAALIDTPFLYLSRRKNEALGYDGSRENDLCNRTDNA